MPDTQTVDPKIQLTIGRHVMFGMFDYMFVTVIAAKSSLHTFDCRRVNQVQELRVQTDEGATDDVAGL